MDLYHEHVLEHYRKPRGVGTLSDATVRLDDANPLCGDTIRVELKIKNENIIGARHASQGCAVSQAGASMLFERLEGMSVADVLALPKEEILSEFGSALSVSRVKCALLALSAVKKALVKIQPNAS
jgi:nitrogen fixation NifU-like protein